MNEKPWAVRDLTRYIRQLIETDYRLQDLEVEGELSNFRIPSSGHAYFTLKDGGAQLQCVMWASDVRLLRDQPRDGDRVIARGHISVYEQGGQYQLYCRTLRLAGVGDLYAQLEALKQRLHAEGLFDEQRKRPVPARPRAIGIVTSPATAALQDVLNVIRRRAPLVRLVLAPTPVQGDQAPPQIVAALQALNRRPDIDVILIVRGGGSLEDLWCFNDEQVVRAAAASTIPVIAGVGHEIDFTLTDLAADLRAPTPSAAAELATSITDAELQAQVAGLLDRARAAVGEAVRVRRRDLHAVRLSLGRLSPRAAIYSARQRTDMLLERAGRAAVAQARLRRARLDGVKRALMSAGPLAALSRGYAIVTTTDGRIVRDAAVVQPADRLRVRLQRGQLQVRVERSEVQDE
ncbi:MAG: exodeoxyribonuclease VII large subunit [Anaerolineae bacterium]